MTLAEAATPIVVRKGGHPGAVAAYVNTHPQGTAFHLPAWLGAIEKATGQKGYNLVAERAGRIVGMLPLTAMRHPLFGKALVSSGFAVGGGLLADSQEIEAALLEEAWKLARALNTPSLELRGGPLPTGEGWTHSSESHCGFVRDLAVDVDAELKAIPRKQRADVRKALESGLTVHTGRSRSDLDAHFSVYAESVRNLGTPVFPRALFSAMLEAFGDEADILTVRHKGVPVASVLSLYYRETVLPYWGGGTWEARRLRANERMYFALMRHAHARGCKTFDFGRSKIGSGPAAYKKNWGFEAQPLTYATRSAEGVTPREVSPSNPKYRMQIALWKKLPLWLANRLGPPLARGLG